MSASMMDKIIAIAGWNRANGGAIRKACGASTIEVEPPPEPPEGHELLGGYVVWVRGGRLYAGVYESGWFGEVKDITGTIRAVA